jgi:hypothetical protein
MITWLLVLEHGEEIMGAAETERQTDRDRDRERRGQV